MAAAHELVMKRLRPWIVIVLVFVAGVIVGVGGTRFAVKKIIDQAMQRPEIVAAKIEKDLTRELKLTEEQKPKLHDIITRGHEELQQLRGEFQPRLRQVLKRSEREIRAMLTDDQRDRFDRMLKKKPIVPSAERFDATPAR